MRRFIFLNMVLTLVLSCNRKEPKLRLIENSYNFDTIYPIESPKAYFRYQNIGNGNLKIDSLDFGCGCTIPKYSKKYLYPNQMDSILVEYDSRQNKGHFVKEIMIYSNTEDSPHKIFIKGLSL